MVGHVVKRDHSLPEFFNRMDSDLQAILKKYFLPFLIVHRYSGCYLPSSSKEDTSNATYYCRIIFISTVVILASYQFLQVGIYLLTIREYNNSVPVIIALFAWSFQSLASLIFLLIWQRKRTFERLFRVLHEPQKSAGILQSTFAIRVVAVVAFLLALLSILLIAASLLQCAGLYDATLPTELFNVYGEKLQFLSIIIIGYTSLFWIISLSVYVNVTICGKQEFEYFNNRLRKLGGLSRNDIFDALMDCFMTHRELANSVREMDRAFQVYTFVMIGTNIPAMTFSLLSVLTAPRNSFMYFILGISSVAFCVVQLISLTAVPAKLHSRILEAEQIIYNCRVVWYPHNEAIYSLARTFISHVNQNNLGVSVWGFAVVTKPLILTTISLTATYLAFVMQMKTSCDCAQLNNVTDVTLFDVIL